MFFSVSFPHFYNKNLELYIYEPTNRLPFRAQVKVFFVELIKKRRRFPKKEVIRSFFASYPDSGRAMSHEQKQFPCLPLSLYPRLKFHSMKSSSVAAGIRPDNLFGQIALKSDKSWTCLTFHEQQLAQFPTSLLHIPSYHDKADRLGDGHLQEAPRSEDSWKRVINACCFKSFFY